MPCECENTSAHAPSSKRQLELRCPGARRLPARSRARARQRHVTKSRAGRAWQAWPGTATKGAPLSSRVLLLPFAAAEQATLGPCSGCAAASRQSRCGAVLACRLVSPQLGRAVLLQSMAPLRLLLCCFMHIARTRRPKPSSGLAAAACCRLPPRAAPALGEADIACESGFCLCAQDGRNTWSWGRVG